MNRNFCLGDIVYLNIKHVPTKHERTTKEQSVQNCHTIPIPNPGQVTWHQEPNLINQYITHTYRTMCVHGVYLGKL